MAESPQLTQELRGWKEIAHHLGVSVRTAQTFEKEQGLPVRRGAGIKAPVFAYPAELLVWKETAIGNGAPRATGEAGVATKVERRWPRFMLIGGLALVLLGVLYWILVPHGPAADFRVDGKNLVVLNAKGKELWCHTFPRDLSPQSYTVEVRNQRNWFGDLDGDGQTELLFAATPENSAEVGSTLLCFRPDGKIQWKFTPGRPVTDAGGDHMTPPYNIYAVQVLAGKTPANTRIAVSSVHYLNQPDQVAILDTRGQILAEYWHPGHLNFMAQADLDGDGRNELLAAGLNNGNHQATLIVLDPWKMSGLMTPLEMTDQRFRLLNLPPAKEKAVVLFPRSCISKGQPYTRVAYLKVHSDRIVILVAEGTDMMSPGFVYEMDYSLRTLSVVPTGDPLRLVHQEMETRGELDHPYSSDDWSRLKTEVVVRHGK